MCDWDPARTPAREWTVVIDASYPSQNDLGGNHKSGWAYRSLRNRLAKQLKDQLNAIPAATRFRAGIITRQYGARKRRYDDENLVGGGKPLVDVLRDYAVLVDDRPGMWRGYYRQERSPDGVDRIVIRLMEY
jgi:hypothetical protein